jgi:transcriptional regulator with XRE-family HTH domain
MTLGNQIKTSRKLAGLTQQQLADKVGMTRQQIARIESDKNSPLHCNVIKIKQALNIPL